MKIKDQYIIAVTARHSFEENSITLEEYITILDNLSNENAVIDPQSEMDELIKSFLSD